MELTKPFEKASAADRSLRPPLLYFSLLSAAVADQLVCLAQPGVQSELVAREVSEDSTPELNRTSSMVEFQSEHADIHLSWLEGRRPASTARGSLPSRRPRGSAAGADPTWLPPPTCAARSSKASSAAPDHVTRSRQHHPASRPARRRHGTELPSSARLVRGYACGLTATGAGAPPRSVRSVSVSRSTNVRCRRDGRTARERERPNPLAPRRYK